MEGAHLELFPAELRDSIVSGTMTVVPGVMITPSTADVVAGEGTYVDAGHLFSCSVGLLEVTPLDEGRVRVSVRGGSGAAIVKPGEVVTAVVARVTPRGARCELRCVGSRPLARPLRAHLPRENVTDANRDRVDMYKSFRPGDVILAKVLPLSSTNIYELTTAEPELGVAIATSVDSPPGVNMVPTGWTEMRCPVTGTAEPRKVAKVVPESAYDLLKNRPAAAI